jgi:2-C-methyl-D-erythritol 4-phosphate cytidylyltransferase/2-C-methyl-D-erythritol 2,4-cyclodiphosphate synthase
MHVAAIIAAGGRGTRIGAHLPKQLLDLGDRTTMLSRTVATFLRCDAIDEIVIALADGTGFHPDAAPKPVRLAPAGDRRQDSVANALAQVSSAADVIVIHDAARPFVTFDLIERTIRAADRHGAAIAALPATDTVKQASDRHDDGTWRIRATLPRDTIYLAQTPQAFRRQVLTDALAVAADVTFTDEAMLVERAGYAVHIVEGDPGNIKITTGHDLTSAKARVQAEDERARAEGEGAGVVMRIGSGYDLHRLVSGRRLVLAGVEIPFERGLDGHSDADIVCHAVTDAVLGATALGDIGRLFTDTDPQWKDADSLVLLRAAVATVRAQQFSITNVDVTVIAERPKLLPYLDRMRRNLADALGIDVAAVSIKGKTNEKVDAAGRGEAMACHAVALVTR